MNYIELNITLPEITQDYRELAVAELAEAGYEAFEETEEGIKAYIVEENYTEKELDTFLFSDKDRYPDVKISTRLIKETNWNSVWESNFSPVEVESFCQIRASFHEPSGRHEHDILIDPRMSFGTGHHSTTWLMISMMQKIEFNQARVLDMGCGTGVLAILAGRLGCSETYAVDIDEWAYRNTVDNCALNGITNCKVIHGDATSIAEEKFDIIMANITRNILMEDIPVYFSSSLPGTALLISGFYDDDIDALRNRAEENGFLYIDHSLRNKWASVLFKRKK